MMGINVDLLRQFLTFLIKKTSRRIVKNEIISNKQLKELHKPIIGKLEKRKVHSPIIDNIWGPDLADMQLINKFNKGIWWYCYNIKI